MRNGLKYTPSRTSYVIRAVDDESRPARMGADLTATEYAPVGVADPRLVDPYLASLVEQAREEARAEGYEAGRRAGYEDGRAEGLEIMAAQQTELLERDAEERAARRERLARLLVAVEDAIAGALDYQAPAVTEMQEVITGLSCDIAASLVGHHLAVGDCTARDAVMRVLTQVPRRVSVTLRLNPADIAEVSQFTGDITDWTVAQVLPDASVAVGDAIAEADNLEVEASLSDALARVREALGQ
ncbi:MAG: FliH/SctL family protein [Mobilicoccus sp.]|nr:FliH/SctL family protein [Mobilicoccus sp.]